jgi:hypothetical protein
MGITDAGTAVKLTRPSANGCVSFLSLSGLTPHEYIAKIWSSEPDRFIVDPIHQMPGLNA